MQVATSYFEAIYTTSNPSNIEESIAAIPIRVTVEMNIKLTKDFTGEEVVAALKQIHLIKALRPDDLSAVFYQKY